MYTYETFIDAIADPNGREIFDPSTGELIGRAPAHIAADIDAAIERATAASPDG